VCSAVVNLRSNQFGPGQAYVTFSQVWSLNGLRLDELDGGKLTNEDTANTDASRRLREDGKIAIFSKIQ
jgi:hypothetical protein